ncbi:MAG: hypothetical protein KA275_05200, partial [Chitinophagaceae bacterium]|nr:hypothetical protein [Chitinophagaceae bacterium]
SNNGAKNETTANPTEFFTKMMEEGKKNMETAMNWSKSIPGMEKVNEATAEFTKNAENAKATFETWSKNMLPTIQDMLSGMTDFQKKDYFKAMFNNQDTYMKMYQLWMPLYSSFQNKSFTPELFQSYFKPEKQKELFDAMFQYAPEEMKGMMNNWEKSMKDTFASMNTKGTESYNEMKAFWEKQTASFENPFTKFSTMYNEMNEQIKTAVNPFMKMMSPGTAKDTMESMQDLQSKMVNFGNKNAEMQFMMYKKGTESLEKFALTLQEKMQKGESMDSFMSFYTEFLNNMDTNFVDLFSSDDFSAIQSELSSIGMKMKKEMDGQMEKAMSSLPIVSRTEMDELYKTVYELNKEVKNLKKELASKNTTVKTAPVKEESAKTAPVQKTAPVAKKAPAKTATKKK